MIKFLAAAKWFAKLPPDWEAEGSSPTYYVGSVLNVSFQGEKEELC